MAEKQNLLRRLLRIEPGIALAQWVWDRVVGNWAALVALFGGSIMSYLAKISVFFEPYGPFGIGAAAVIFALLIWWGLARAALARASSGVKRAEQGAIEKWKQAVDSINPLDTDFQRQRIKLSDLAHPVTRRVANKRFVDCELIGPANIAFYNPNPASTFSFADCDLVVMNPAHAVPMNNVVLLENIHVINCRIFNCTVFIPPNLIPSFRNVGAQFVSFTGDSQIDSPQPSDTEQKTQP